MTEKYLIGIDIGTTGCKSVVVDYEGNIAGSTFSGYPLVTPRPGWAEQDPAQWWIGVRLSLAELLKNSGITPHDIAAVGLSGQMHGLVALDSDFRVLRPAILWNDQRAETQCDFIHEKVGGVQQLLRLTNNRMLPGYTGGKILWMRENEPELYEKTRYVLNPKDYIRYLLTGEIATEVSDASGTGLFDVKQRRWSDTLLELLDIPKERLPQCFESTEITGKITREASEQTGLVESTPVVGGGGDAVIQTTGMGIVGPGVLGIILGSGGVVAVALTSFHENTDGRLQIFCNNERELWHVMGVTLAAGGSLRWYRDTLSEAQKEKASQEGRDVYEVLDELAAAAPAGSRGLLFLPYLIGERCPHVDPRARGAFIGIGLHHGRSELTRSILEGVSFSLLDVFGLLRPMMGRIEEIRISGGGSVSQLWRQIIADVFQQPVAVVRGSREGGAFGAALVAGVGIGIWSNLEEATHVLRIENRNEPNRNAKDIYEKLYEVYHGLYNALKPAHDSLSSTEK